MNVCAKKMSVHVSDSAFVVSGAGDRRVLAGLESFVCCKVPAPGRLFG